MAIPMLSNPDLLRHDIKIIWSVQLTYFMHLTVLEVTFLTAVANSAINVKEMFGFQCDRVFHSLA